MSAATATPIVVLGQTRTRAVEARLAKCLQAWRSEWSVMVDRECAVEIAPLTLNTTVEAARAAVFIARGRVGDAACVYVLMSDVGIAATIGLPSLASSSAHTEGALAKGLANELTDSLARAVLVEAQYQVTKIEVTRVEASELESDAPLERWWCATLSDGLRLLLAPQLLALLAPARKSAAAAALHKRRAAIGGETVALQAVLGDAQVSVGELSSLRVNDVIVLAQSLAEPGYLRTRSGRQVASVSLGRSDNKRAVVIVKQ